LSVLLSSFILGRTQGGLLARIFVRFLLLDVKIEMASLRTGETRTNRMRWRLDSQVARLAPALCGSTERAFGTLSRAFLVLAPPGHTRKNAFHADEGSRPHSGYDPRHGPLVQKVFGNLAVQQLKALAAGQFELNFSFRTFQAKPRKPRTHTKRHETAETGKFHTCNYRAHMLHSFPMEV